MLHTYTRNVVHRHLFGPHGVDRLNYIHDNRADLKRSGLLEGLFLSAYEYGLDEWHCFETVLRIVDTCDIRILQSASYRDINNCNGLTIHCAVERGTTQGALSWTPSYNGAMYYTEQYSNPVIHTVVIGQGIPLDAVLFVTDRLHGESFFIAPRIIAEIIGYESPTEYYPPRSGEQIV